MPLVLDPVPSDWLVSADMFIRQQPDDDEEENESDDEEDDDDGDNGDGYSE